MASDASSPPAAPDAARPGRSDAGSGADRGPDVGARLRRLRESYGISQRELARRAGVTNGSISLIEQNRVSPTVASLKKVLAGFPLALADFFGADPAPRDEVFHAAADLVRLASGGVELRQVGSAGPGRMLQVLHERYAPGGDTGEQMLAHDGEEAGVVVRGRVEVTVGGRTRVLGPGDAYAFSSRIPHRFRNLAAEPCEIVSACTPPTF